MRRSRRAGRVRRAAVPAPDPGQRLCRGRRSGRPGVRHRRPGRGAGRRAARRLAGALPRAAARRPGAAAAGHHRACCAPPCANCSAAPSAGCDHFDVETYTWGVLPAARRPNSDAELADGIAAELAFARDELVDLGLTPCRPRVTAMTEPAGANMAPLVVLDVVGLTPRLLAHMPRLRAVAETGFQAALGTVLPAVTCSVQATFLTGAPPSEHGIVGNGWYFRDLGEVFLWRQHHALVGGEKVWQAARQRATRLHGGQRLLVVRHGRGRRLDRDAPADLLRRRAQGAGLLHRPAGAARRADRQARRRSRCSPTGGRAPGCLVALDLPGGRADHGRPTTRT